MEKRISTFALFCSVVIHASIFLLLSKTKIASRQEALKQIEVTYEQVKSADRLVPQKPQMEVKRFEEKEIMDDVDILSKEQSKFTDVGKNIKDISKFEGLLRFDKKQAPKIPTKDMSRRITVPMVQMEKISNPNYLSYNDNIRRKIKQQAYAHIKHPDFEAGEVYLTFILSSGGSLKDIKVIEEKTNANTYLRSVGLRSVKESSPFPPFPQELSYPELTFNVVISFEVK